MQENKPGCKPGCYFFWTQYIYTGHWPVFD